MTSVLPDLERDLVDAAQRRARRPNVARARGGLLVRWLRRRSRAAQILLGLAVVSAAAASAATLTGTRSQPLTGAVSSNVRYRIVLTPALLTGTSGWCLFEQQTTASGKALVGVGGCGASPATLAAPLFASLEGPTIVVVTAPAVAAVRVLGGPTILTRADPSLPFGFRAAVYHVTRLTGILTVRQRSLVALDADGRVIRQGGSGREALQSGFASLTLPIRPWARPGEDQLISGLVDHFPHQNQAVATTPAVGGCQTVARGGSGLRAEGGVDTTNVARDPAVLGRAFLDCSDTVFTRHGKALVATVLLDAKDPGALPAALPQMHPLAGQPGIFSVPGSRLLWSAPMEARRFGQAWIVVEGSSSRVQLARDLRELEVAQTRFQPRPVSPTGPRGVPCSIDYQSAPGLLETVQEPWRGIPPRWGPNPRLYPCTKATFYLNDWPLNVEVFAPINEPGTPTHPPLRPVPGHPNTYVVAANGYTGAGIWRRRGNTWLTITGGSGEQQQLTLSDHLAIGLKTP